MNYTKGKWIFDEAHLLIRIAPPGFDGIAIINYKQTSSETQANAHLIASAPDMYEALKSALALLDKQREEYNSAVTILPHKPVGEGEVAKAARKALAKAESK